MTRNTIAARVLGVFRAPRAVQTPVAPAPAPSQRSLRVRLIRLAARAAAVLAAVSVLWVALYRVADPAFTPSTVIAGWQEPGRPVAMQWLPLPQIPRPLQQAVIASEDMRFCEHWGFDFTAIGMAISDAWDGERLRGASTLSMQTARMLFLPPSRSPLRKLAEAWFTLLIEAAYSKERILSLYLNTVHWGPGFYGAAAAARHHFGRDLAALSSLELAQLAALLPNPEKWQARSADRIDAARRIRLRITQMAWPRAGICP